MGFEGDGVLDPGQAPLEIDVGALALDPQILRSCQRAVELLDLAPGCLPEFREFLTWRWRSALAGAPGLHEARLCRHRKRPGSYLIWSTWSPGARPVSLASLLQPGFRVPQRRLRLLRSHGAFRIPCEADWQVGADLRGKSAFLTQGES